MVHEIFVENLDIYVKFIHLVSIEISLKKNKKLSTRNSKDLIHCYLKTDKSLENNML